MNLWATAGNGPVKYPVIRAKTDRVDVEVIGPEDGDDADDADGGGEDAEGDEQFLFHGVVVG